MLLFRCISVSTRQTHIMYRQIPKIPRIPRYFHVPRHLGCSRTKPPHPSGTRQYYTNPVQLQTKPLPIKTVLMLIIGSSSLTMIAYVLVQLAQFNHQDESHRTVFLTLWANPNILWPKKLNFPHGLKYLDEDVAKVFEGEIHPNVANYTLELQNRNISYAVLLELSSNSTIKKLFGLPIVVQDPYDFEIWIESNQPTVSGIKFDFWRAPQSPNATHISHKDVAIGCSWQIKPINISSAINDFLILAGLKLHRLKPNDLSPEITGPRSADYQIRFAGHFRVKDKNHFEQGLLSYEGILDLDHLAINRGVKIERLDVTLDSSSERVFVV